MRLNRTRQHTPHHPRRAHAAPAAQAPPPEAPARDRQAEASAENNALSAERRLRGAGGPEDRATYACRCGAVFPASPTTSVSCPLCGVHQAW
jgi:hypothetical protein